jgi:hypothetical protein
MNEPIELWKQSKIEGLSPGESFLDEFSFNVYRYKDGWHFYWKNLSRSAGWCSDLGRFFDEDRIWEMRNFMSGKWDRGILIVPPTREELV